jgi:hypothetical protein
MASHEADGEDNDETTPEFARIPFQSSSCTEHRLPGSGQKRRLEDTLYMRSKYILSTVHIACDPVTGAPTRTLGKAWGRDAALRMLRYVRGLLHACQFAGAWSASEDKSPSSREGAWAYPSIQSSTFNLLARCRARSIDRRCVIASLVLVCVFRLWILVSRGTRSLLAASLARRAGCQATSLQAAPCHWRVSSGHNIWAEALRTGVLLGSTSSLSMYPHCCTASNSATSLVQG